MHTIRLGLAIAVTIGWALPAWAECTNGRAMLPLNLLAQPDQQSAPGKVVVRSAGIERGPDTAGTLCIAIGSLGFELVPPADDRTPPAGLGYAIEMVRGGAAWERFDLLLTVDGQPAPLLAQQGWVWVNFMDAPEEAVDWSFQLAAVDEDGNQGEWSDEVQVSHPGENFGCATTGTAGRCGLAWLGLGLAWRIRRRRAGRGQTAGCASNRFS